MSGAPPSERTCIPGQVDAIKLISSTDVCRGKEMIDRTQRSGMRENDLMTVEHWIGQFAGSRGWKLASPSLPLLLISILCSERYREMECIKAMSSSARGPPPISLNSILASSRKIPDVLSKKAQTFCSGNVMILM